ncbi:lipid-A-disaccharide synthase [candidate division KSB1 bacterium]|nr:lipid-A-disaccharide synthase [candidate division KSB1 bacterium]
MARIFISTGEVSGDLYGGHLVAELKQFLPTAHFYGIGGDHLLEQGVELFYHVRQMGIVGVLEVVRHIPFIRRVFRHLRTIFEARRPDLLIVIDYPGFNLRLAAMAKTMGIPVIYYITPQIWAWGFNRIKKIRAVIDQAIVILPFEAAIFQGAGVPATFVGHPLLDFLKPRLTRAEFFEQYHLQPEKKLLGLLPGSRFSEVTRLLPEMVKTVNYLRLQLPELQVVVARVGNIPLSVYQSIPGDAPAIQLLEQSNYDIMRSADALIIASGTATLEAALLGTPMVLVYRTSRITYWLGRAFVKIKWLGLPNIIAGAEIIPEFIQQNCRAEKLSPVLAQLLLNSTANQHQREKLQQIQAQMGAPGATRRAAQLVVELIERLKTRTRPEIRV